MSKEWDQEGEHRRADFEHLLNRMKMDHEQAVIEAAEASLAAVEDGDCPPPMSVHPALAQYVEIVRGSRGHHPIRLPRVQRFMATFENSEPTVASVNTLILTPRKAAAPAPFVGRCWGDEACYTWRVWTDDHGRHIATDAELVWR